MSERWRKRDAWLAVLAFGLSLGLYLRTLYPGLNGIGDTPKFQFVGAVLGTAHAPGYPVYTLLGWLFSKLPFGNLAWRINLLSALSAAVAVALLFLLVRRLGVSASVAFATALSFAAGPVWWSQATLAEVYALAGAFLAAVFLAVTAWGETRAPRALERAIFLTALAMAHHTTVAMVVPALAVYVIASDPSFLVSPRRLARGAGFVLLGLAPYLYVLVRSLQAASYLGARARTPHELFAVMRGAAFEERLFAFDLGRVLGERVPAVFAGLRGELALGGVALAVLGLLSLAGRAPKEAWLLGLSALGLLAFAVNYDVPDFQVFLIPAFVALWPLVGCGIDAVAKRLERRLSPRLLLVLVLALPAGQAALHFKASDHSQRTFEMRYFAALFESLPARAAIAAESYTVDHMVLYELLGEGRARGRDVITVPGDPESVASALGRGYAVYAFERTAAALRPLGYPVAALGLPDKSLDDYLRSIPAQRFVMQAGWRHGQRIAALGTAARPDSRIERGDGARLSVAKGSPLGPGTAPVEMRADNDSTGAVVLAGGRRLVRADAGLAFAVLGPGGRALEAHVLEGPDSRVPFTASAFPLFRVLSPPACVDFGEGAWVNTTLATSSGRLLLRVDNHAPFEARLVLWANAASELSPRLVRFEGEGKPLLEVSSFEANTAARARALRADGLAGLPAGASLRLELRVDDGGQFAATTLDLGGLPLASWAKAKVDLANPRRAQACSLVPGDVAPLDETLRLAVDAGAAPFLGAGWHDAEGEGFRWTASRDAALLLPVLRPADLALRLRIMPLVRTGGAPQRVSLLVGSEALETRTMLEGWSVYEWSVPAALVRAGTNLIRVRAERIASPKQLGLGSDERALGVAVSDLVARRR